MSRIVRAALTQTCNVYEPMPETVAELSSLGSKLDELRQANLEHHAQLIAKAAAQGAQIICLGELFSGPYFALDRLEMWRELAESPVDGPSVLAMQALAREHSLLIIAPIYELSESGERFNTAVVIDETGQLLGKYRKCHIPEGTNDQGSFCETFYYDKSDGNLANDGDHVGGSAFFPVFETTLGKIGVSICYDRHFPGVAQALADGGAEMVFSPAVTFGSKSRRMWEMEFAVDATRHLLFIGGSNRQGSEPPWNQPYFGASYFVGPNGRLPNLSKDEELVIADLPLHELDGDDPSGWNFPRDTRPGIYGDKS